MKAYFIFNEINSKDLSIVVNTLPPLQLAEEQGSVIKVPGRDGYLFQPDGSYAPVLKEIQITLKELTPLPQIKTWLRGEGKLYLSSEPGVFYKGRVTGQVDFEKLLIFKTATIKFLCQPFGYLEDGLELITITQGAVLQNPGTHSSLPIIKIYGTGTITLTVNSSNIILSNVTDYMTVNSELFEAYRDLVNKNNDMQGEFPALLPGENAISWTGSVTKLEIIPNWRNL